MIIPVSCKSCGKPIAHLWESYEEMVRKGESKKDALDKVGLTRTCCRTEFLTHVDLIDTAAAFKKY